MTTAIEGLKPQLLWKYFAEISRIPRCSKNEAAIARYVLDVAQRLGLEGKSDAAGNVVVRKPASPGRERARTVILQGHLDMVCEKNKDKAHDFSKDPIELVRNGNILMADGTTLGADNGVAVATELALMEDRNTVHGPLELLFTVDEETGLTGASSLAPGFLEGRTLLNLDSEEEGAIYVGCAGGKDTVGTWAVVREPAPAGAVGLAVKVGGLRGGHSGLDIDKGRGNAIKILNRVLLALGAMSARLASLEGGSKRNAIPREAEALLALPAPRLKRARKVVAEYESTIKAELATVEPDLYIRLEEAPSPPETVIRRIQQKKILQTICGLPHGVIKMSADISGLVETSTNVAVLKTEDASVSLATSQRSSVASEILEICQTVRAVFELGGSKVESSQGYPGWKPNLTSPILKLARARHVDLFGKEPAVKAVHAGLECGIIGEKFPGMDMISVGPTLEGVHSPDEKIHIDTVERFWDYLLAILRDVN